MYGVALLPCYASLWRLTASSLQQSWKDHLRIGSRCVCHRVVSLASPSAYRGPARRHLMEYRLIAELCIMRRREKHEVRTRLGSSPCSLFIIDTRFE